MIFFGFPLDDLESTCIIGRMKKNTTVEQDIADAKAGLVAVIIGAIIMIIIFATGPHA